MPLLMQPAVEADLERIVEILFEAFAPDPLTQIMFPRGGEDPEAKNKALEQNRKDFHNPVITYMKIVDTDLNDEVIAFAKWYIYKEARPESEWKKPEVRDYGEGANQEAIDAFFGQLTEKRWKHLEGKPHYLLSVLDTHPDHQRRGAGGKLVQWGADAADKAGLFCWLEASTAGYHLYRKKGFEDVDVIEVDTRKWGGKGIERSTCMKRPAKQVAL